ncbi:protein SON isoform X1 [Trichogramma pretiosum]|uniref:protein SON isoform X1 n=1 Tax=Trichogramma pretiosum TaxID=7493 RepID=UPI0006C94F19|nr:protein SON isoform X1 [Trichogramma pretiosum]
MGDLFDLAGLITRVGVDAVKIKPEPGLPEKSSNEILTELFSTFDGVDVNTSSSSSSSDEDDNDDDNNKKDDAGAEADADDAEKVNGNDDDKDVDDKKRKRKDSLSSTGKKKKKKKKHKHKHDDKDKEKKHKHKKKSKDDDDNSPKKSKKKKKSKHKSESDLLSDSGEPKIKKIKVEKDADTEKKSRHKKSHSKKDIEPIKIKEEKKDPKEDETNVERQEEIVSSPFSAIPKKLTEDSEAPEVPKLLEKTSTKPTIMKIMIKDLKNSEVFNNTVKKVEEEKKEKADKLEEGEITDSDDEDKNNMRTPSLSPSPVSHRRYSRSPRRQSRTRDLRNLLKEKEKIKRISSHRSRSRNGDRHARSRSPIRSRYGRGRSRDRRNSFRNDSDRYVRDRDNKFSHSEDRSKPRGRSRSRERKERIEIDKKKLLEIARRNAINMIKKGKLSLPQQDKAIAAIKSGGKTVEELTDYCKTLSKSEALGELSSISSGDESGDDKGFQHPFLLKDKPSSIIMNIRDSKQLPTKTMLEKSTEAQTQLRLQYPVSSGQQHRKNEKEWVPVPTKPKNSKQKKPEPKKMFIPAKEVLHNKPLPLVVPPMSEQITAQQMQQASAAAAAINAEVGSFDPNTQNPYLHYNAMVPVPYDPMAAQAAMYNQPVPQPPMYDSSIAQQMVPPMPIAAVDPNVNSAYVAGGEAYAQAQCAQTQYASDKDHPVTEVPNTESQEHNTSIFPEPPAEPLDISAIVSQRLAAMRKLSENPNDSQALKEMYQAQNGMQTWVESKQIPGQFTGSTGVKVLTQAELNSGYQAWARKDQLQTAQPVAGGMGMHLLQKMGWRPGEGLGKNKEGTLEPLSLEVKLDKRGLVTDQDIPQQARPGIKKKEVIPSFKSLEGKHPVSLLGEFCSKRKYCAPLYEICFESGPDHKKNFVFKVTVNGVEYKPAVASPNKKLAKAEAAQVCLQSLGLLPSSQN